MKNRHRLRHNDFLDLIPFYFHWCINRLPSPHQASHLFSCQSFLFQRIYSNLSNSLNIQKLIMFKLLNISSTFQLETAPFLCLALVLFFDFITITPRCSVAGSSAGPREILYSYKNYIRLKRSQN